MAKKMFDFCIGNPPYQESQNDTSDKPVYNYLLDAAYDVCHKAVFITPARFLFNAGKTPKAWNNKMLHDKHLKVLMYEHDSNKVFSGTNITGGVAVTYRNADADFGAIEVFSPYSELQSLTERMRPYVNENNLPEIMFLQNRFNLEALYCDHPELKALISSDGRERRIVSSAFNKLSVFTNNDILEDDEVSVLGLEGSGNTRTYKVIKDKYIEDNGNLHFWKVLVSKSNGASGTIGSSPARITTTPFVIGPDIAYTQSFIGVGSFQTRNEAEAALKYMKSRFVRCLLGILKITQDNPPDRWKWVPIQDFTSSSDIDWTKSVHEIDLQLYRKYGLSVEEINFIETHVKEMV